MQQNVSECTSEHVQFQNFLGEAPQTPRCGLRACGARLISLPPQVDLVPLHCPPTFPILVPPLLALNLIQL